MQNERPLPYSPTCFPGFTAFLTGRAQEPPASAGLDIGSGEAGACGEQRLARHLREGVSEAVSEIERRRVPAFHTYANQPGNFNLLGIYANDCRAGSQTQPSARA